MAKAGEIVAKLRLDIADYQKNIDKSKHELEEFGGVASKVAKVSVVAITAIVTAMTAVATAGGKMALEQEKSMAKMQASTGATAEEMEAFKKSADNLFANGRGDFEEIYSTLTKVKQVLGLTGDEAEKTADQALILSNVFGWEVEESIRAVDSAQKAWGGTSEETFDIFTALAQQAGDKSGDLLDTFNEYAPILSEAGFSMEEFADILNTGMENGAFNFDKIGDALKEFNVRLTDGSTQANGMADALFGSTSASNEFFAGISDGSITGSQALKIITGKLGEIEDPIKRNTLGVAYFGSMWEDLGGNVVLAMGNAEDSLLNVEGATKKTGQALDDNVATKIDAIKAKFVLWTKDIGEKLLPALNSLADVMLSEFPAMLAVASGAFVALGNFMLGFIETLITVSGFILRNKEAFMVLGGVILGFLMPIIVSYSSLVLKSLVMSAVKMIATNIGLIATYWKLGLAMMGVSTTMMAIFGIVGILVAVGLLLWKNWDKVTAVFAKFGITGESIRGVIDRLVNGAKGLWESFKALEVVGPISEAFKVLGASIGGLFGAIKELTINGVQKLVSGWNELTGGFIGFGGIANMLSTFISNLGSSISGLWESFKGSTIFAIIGSYVSTLVGNFTNLFDAIQKVITSGDFSPLIDAVMALLPTIIGMLLGGIPRLLFIGYNIVRAIADGMGLTVPELIEKVTEMITSAIEQFAIMLPQLVETGATMLTSIVEGFLSAIPGFIDSITLMIESYVGLITTMLPIFLDTGIQIIMSLVEGILSMLPVIIETYISLLTTVIDTIVTMLPVIIETGILLITSLLDGILSALPVLIEGFILLLNSLIDLIVTMLPIIVEAGIQILMALIDGIVSALPAILGAIILILTALLQVIIGLLPIIVEAGIMILMALVDGLNSVLDVLIDTILLLLMSIIETIIELLPVILEAGIKILLALIDGIISILPALVDTAITLVLAILDAIITSLPKILDAGIKLLLALISGILQILPQLVSAGLKLILSLAGALLGALPTIIGAGIKILLALIKGIISILPQLIGAGLKLIAQLAMVIIQNAPKILSAGVKLIIALISGVLSMIGSVRGAIGDIATAILDKIKSISLVDIGKDLIRGLWNGISNMTGWISTKLEGFGDSVLGGIKSFFGIHSPSRVFRDEIGVMLVRGLNVGMEKMKDLPIDTLASLSKNMVDSFNPELTANAVGIVDSIVDGASALKNVVGNLGFEIGTPQIAGLGSDFGTVYPDTLPVGNGDNGTNYNGPLVNVENMNVNDESDVRQVSKELFNLQRSHDRSKGGK